MTLCVPISMPGQETREVEDLIQTFEQLAVSLR